MLVVCSVSGDFEQEMLGGNSQWIFIKSLMPQEICQSYLLKLLCLFLAAVAGLSDLETSQSIAGAV